VSLTRFVFAHYIDQKGGRASILYDAKEAAGIDDQTVLAVAQNGLTELIADEPAFAQFKVG
jgi:hypothetical protein